MLVIYGCSVIIMCMRSVNGMVVAGWNKHKKELE